MEKNEMFLFSDNTITDTETTVQKTSKQRKINARKRVEDYMAEKELQENISYFDLEY